MIVPGYAMPLCGRLLPGSSPKEPCFLTTASPICLRMLMSWQVAQHITILQQLLKHISALKHSWHLGQRCCVGHGSIKYGFSREIKMKPSWNNESGSMPVSFPSHHIPVCPVARAGFDYCRLIWWTLQVCNVLQCSVCVWERESSHAWLHLCAWVC